MLTAPRGRQDSDVTLSSSHNNVLKLHHRPHQGLAVTAARRAGADRVRTLCEANAYIRGAGFLPQTRSNYAMLSHRIWMEI